MMEVDDRGDDNAGIRLDQWEKFRWQGWCRKELRV